MALLPEEMELAGAPPAPEGETPKAAQENASQAGTPGASTLRPAPRSTPEQRAKWQAKREKRKLKLKQEQLAPGSTQSGSPAPEARQSQSAIQRVESDVAAAHNAIPPVLWSAEHIRPLVAECVPVAEALDLRNLKALASNVSPEAVALVEAKSGWHPVSKKALIHSLPECLAKWLNAAGISSEHKEEITLAGALVAILYSSMSLRNDLRAMALEKSEARQQARKEIQNANQHGSQHGAPPPPPAPTQN